MITKKEASITRTVNQIISGIDSTDLSFDKKRSLMIKRITEYYSEDFLSTQEIIARKNSLERDKATMYLFLMPLVIGAVSLLLTSGLLESLTAMRRAYSLGSFESLIVELLLFFMLFSLFYMVCNMRNFIGRKYNKFDLLDCEIEIIYMVLEARNLLNAKNE